MAMWKNDDEMFALMKEKLYTPVVVIFWIRWAISTSSCPLPSARWLHRCLPHPTSCPERKRTSA